MFFIFSNYFDVLVSKIIFFLKKNIILIYFKIKITLKNNNYHTFKKKTSKLQITIDYYFLILNMLLLLASKP
jgi:hypothetical protein